MTSQPPMMKDTDSFTHERWNGITRPYTEATAAALAARPRAAPRP